MRRPILNILFVPLMVFAQTPADELARARVLQQNHKLAEARASYQRARQQASEQHNDAVWADALQGMAQVDLSTGRYRDCIAEGSEALSRLRAAPRNKLSRNQEAAILTTVGQARFYAGDSAQALSDFQNGLVIARETSDRQAETVRLNDIGNVYYALGQYGEAYNSYQSALDRLNELHGESWFAGLQQLTQANLAVLYQRIGQYNRALQIYRGFSADPAALPTVQRAQMLSNMGTLYRRLGDPVAALEQYRAAQTLYRSGTMLAGEVGVLNNIGILQATDLNDFEPAVASFTQALERSEKSGGKRLVMTARLYRGEALLREGKTTGAAADFKAASELAAELTAEEEQWRADYGLARTADAAGDKAGSNALLHKAVDIIERMRRKTFAASGRSGFLADRRDVYDFLIDREAASASPDIDTVFRLMEQSRARDLQDRIPAKAAGLDALRATLPADTLLLEYWLGANSMVVTAVSTRSRQLLYHRLSESEMAALMELPAILQNAARADWRERSRIPAALLLTGIKDMDFAGLRRLIIVPDGELGRIPFEALPAGPQLLMERFSISYLPFAAAFRTRAQPRSFLPPWTRTLMAFANPLPGAAGPGLGMAEEERQKLPDSAKEVENAAAATGGVAALYLGREARKQPLSSAKEGAAPILHFATHAFADPEDPERSYILFAGAQRGFDYLFLKEAANLRAARGSLVTVSACDSGAGKLARGEGIQSFASAFLAAGAKAVVTSLWRIGDKASEDLMTRFYESLSAGEDAESALRDAKLAFLHSPGASSHPAYWAAFVLSGDGATRIPVVIGWKAGSLGLLLILASVVVAFKMKAGRA